MGREIEWVFPKTCGSCIKLSRRVVDLESALAAAKERIAELESENARLRAEVGRLNYERNNLHGRLKHLVSVMGVFDEVNKSKIDRLTALVQEHQTYTPKQSIKESD